MADGVQRRLIRSSTSLAFCPMPQWPPATQPSPSYSPASHRHALLSERGVPVREHANTKCHKLVPEYLDSISATVSRICRRLGLPKG